MNFGVLGTGTVGQTLAKRLVELGHDVRMGSRTNDNPKGLAFERQHKPKGLAGTFADAAEAGEVLLNCTTGAASLQVLAACGEKNLDGKVLIDIANPLDFSGGVPALSTPSTDSLAEQIQRAHPKLRVVKALNMMNAAVMVEPARVASGNHDAFMCGNDAAAKKIVGDL